ncbi:MAG: bifunctional glutamate N-acetyltransferase/amino-acid acetyltransferase ArgJ [Clostridia bacterium]|nr:bifunctional glutamate N-acetyltransferase/amino-acid acetyltransferase ArgJ [Clostridia bacterium]
MEYINGGVCAPKGFKASGIHCGIRKNKTKRDLALIVSDCKASAAAIYTLNLVKGAPIYVTKDNISDGTAQAMICNSGNANTCNADGVEIATKMCEITAAATGVAAKDVIVASTGVIGQPLDITPIADGMHQLVSELGYDNSTNAAEAIMTTDTAKKEFAVSFTLGGKECRMGGIAKGSGMIHPNMATMLVFITTDAAISPELLHKALYSDAQKSFNMISIDGDTSTNDMVSVMANGMAGNETITEENEDFEAFKKALAMITEKLCRAIAKDGEGATKLVECFVSGGKDWHTAKTVAKSVICSSLFKAAMFGADANWGRVLCAIGYSGADVDVTKIDVSFTSEKGTIEVCKDGAGVPFSEEKAKEILLCDEIKVNVNLNDGDSTAVARGCDLTYDYVKINGDYRT